jgi:DNA-binding IclR family transcriptional regulator
MTHRIVTILDIFGNSAEALSIGQVSVRSGLPRSSVHRILQQLVQTRWVEHRDDGYALGRRPFEIGTLIMRHGQVTDAARPLVQQLSARTGHVVHLAVLDHNDVVYLDKAGGPFAGTLPSRVGGRLTAHCTGVGKALLAFAPAAVFDQYLQAGLRRRTSASITSPALVSAAINEIRETGYATEREEAVPGVACVAAPVFGPEGAVAAISVCGPRDRIRAAELRCPVTEAAAEISRSLTAVPR